jgi:hypothetical protein
MRRSGHGRWCTGLGPKSEDTRGVRAMSATTPPTPKFGPCLRRVGQLDHFRSDR